MSGVFVFVEASPKIPPFYDGMPACIRRGYFGTLAISISEPIPYPKSQIFQIIFTFWYIRSIMIEIGETMDKQLLKVIVGMLPDDLTTNAIRCKTWATRRVLEPLPSSLRLGKSQGTVSESLSKHVNRVADPRLHRP